MILLVIHYWRIFCEIAFKRLPLDLTDDKSILVPLIAWGRQEISHYMHTEQDQCLRRQMASLDNNGLRYVF